MKLFYVLIIIHIFFSLQQNPFQSQKRFSDIFKNNKEEVKIQIDQNDIKDLDLRNTKIEAYYHSFEEKPFNSSCLGIKCFLAILNFSSRV